MNVTEREHKKRKYSSTGSHSITLIDFNNTFPSYLLSKFSSKQRKSFASLKNKLIEQVGNISEGFKTPFDVKICHAYECIIVSDHGNDAIRFLNLWNWKLIKTISIGVTPVYIDVVENDEQAMEGNSLIVTCCDGHVYKYSLFEMLNKSDSNLNYLWKSHQQFDGPAGLNCHGKIIYFCDPYLNFSILSLEDGSVLEQINFGFEVWNVQVINDFTLMLTNNDDQFISIVKKLTNTDWKTIKKIQFNEVFNAVFDSVSNKIVSVTNNSIKIMDLEGNTESESDINIGRLNSEPYYVGGCTLNPYTGELYVAHYSSNSIRVFK